MSPTRTSHFATCPPVVNLGSRSVKSFISRKIAELPVSRQIMQFHVFFQVTHPLLTNSADVCSCMQFHVFSPLSFLLPIFLNCPKDFFGGNNKRLPFFSPLRGSIESFGFDFFYCLDLTSLLKTSRYSKFTERNAFSALPYSIKI